MNDSVDVDALEQWRQKYSGYYGGAGPKLDDALTALRQQQAELRIAKVLTEGAYNDGEAAITRVSKLELDLKCLEESTVDKKAYEQKVAEIARLRTQNKDGHETIDACVAALSSITCTELLEDAHAIAQATLDVAYDEEAIWPHQDEIAQLRAALARLIEVVETCEEHSYSDALEAGRKALEEK